MYYLDINTIGRANILHDLIQIEMRHLCMFLNNINNSCHHLLSDESQVASSLP